MTTPNLAKIERVDLREAWPNEARDFTPWLAENIAELGEALGMDLEWQETEAAVGSYSLDVLAIDLNQNRPVIIENQLETTNHDHLGKLLTYAAGYDANVIVWLTREFRDEHRQALDWLNQRTGEDTQFFGVVLELFQIGESPYAPHFKLVSTPNDWQKATITKTGNRLVSSTQQGERYRSFFQDLIDILREEHKFTKAKVGQPQNWYSFSAGSRTQVKYAAAFIRQKQAKVEVNVESSDYKWNKRLFDRLFEDKEEIELALGKTLEWSAVEGRKACRIALVRPGSIEGDTDTLTEIREWMVENLLELRRVFEPKLDNLVPYIDSLIQEQATIE